MQSRAAWIKQKWLTSVRSFADELFRSPLNLAEVCKLELARLGTFSQPAESQFVCEISSLP